MRLLVTAAIVILGLGAFALPRGASLGSTREELKARDGATTTNGRLSAPLWIGGAAVLAGLAIIITMTRKRA